MTSQTTRTVTALAGAAGVLLLAGCSGAADAEDGATSGGAEYADGTYTAEGSYQTPETVETISVTLTLTGGSVSDVEVTGDPQARETEQYQGQFIAGISAEVDGKKIDELQIDRVAGSSLTSGGFNQALEKIKQQASE
ncbi:FMN-binding protein [Microbacterium sp. KUDC0406]|uniref:FMN-binding protein n=1 Tax=Microbacterium sp. KUDC0406 TaxID=2909588 RepID=UPI001F349CE6|nr:FMN-binding protein [Microbacterium sp. KUDC0406]UJP10565.1 FMN-binding protein [Microbacterium sp. KUDC0406]